MTIRLKPKVFLAASVLLPLIVPAIALMFKGLIPIVLQLSVVMGGWVYVPFAVGLLLWMRNKDEGRILRVSWVVPVVFVPVFCAYILVYQFTRSWVSADNVGALDVLSLLLGYSIYVLIIGYLYVIAVNLLYSALSKLGLISG